MFNVQPSLIYCIGFVLLYILGTFVRSSKVIGITALLLFLASGLVDNFLNANFLGFQNLLNQDSFNLIKVAISLVMTVSILYIISERKINSKSHIYSIYALSTLGLLITSTEKFVTILVAIEACFLIITALTRANYLKRNFLGICITGICYTGILAVYGSLDFSFGTIKDETIYSIALLVLISSLILRVCQFIAITAERPDSFVGTIYSILLVSIFPTLTVALAKFSTPMKNSDYLPFVLIIVLLGLVVNYLISLMTGLREGSFSKFATIVVYLGLIANYIVILSNPEEIYQALIYSSFAAGLSMLLILINNSDDKGINIRGLFARSLSSAVLFILGTTLFIVLLITEIRMQTGSIWMLSWSFVLGLFGLTLVRNFHILPMDSLEGEMIGFNWLKFGLKLSLILGFSMIAWGMGLMNLYVH